MLLQQPKKLIILNILAILKKYTDEEHRLSQKEIADLLLSEYGMRVDRKAIRRNILNLIDCGYDIEFSEVKRSMTNNKTGEAEENSIMTDFYLVRLTIRKFLLKVTILQRLLQISSIKFTIALTVC